MKGSNLIQSAKTEVDYNIADVGVTPKWMVYNGKPY